MAQMVKMANPACQAPQALLDPLDLEETLLLSMMV